MPQATDKTATAMTTMRLASTSILVGLVVLGLKSLAYAMTGSVALYSDALESVVNVATAVAALVAVRVSARPPDRNHPFGHHKAEYFAAVLEGALIVIAAFAIFRQAYFAVLSPRALGLPFEGLAVNALAGLVNAVWAAVLIRHGRKLRSPALVADGRHLVTDVLSSIGVIAGIVLAGVTGWALLDPALAALVAVNIVWSGWGLLRTSVGGLMDEAAAPDLVEQVRELISRHADGALEAHDLRTRHAGSALFVEFHLVVPGDMAVADAHDICDRIEQALRQEIAGSVTTIHVEPEAKAKQAGIPVLTPG